MAVRAARTALDRAGVVPEEIDLILYSGSMHKDFYVWTAANRIQYLLGARRAWAFEAVALCTTNVLALKLARDLMTADRSLRTTLICGGHRTGNLINLRDHTTRFLFNLSDGGSAIVLRRDHAANEVLASSFITDGSLSEDVTIPAGGARLPTTVETLRAGLHTFHVSDSAHLKAGLDGASERNFVQVVRESVERSGARQKDIAFLAINHMKPSMHKSILATLGLREDQSLYLSEYGHIGAPDQVLALELASQRGQLRDGRRQRRIGLYLGRDGSPLGKECGRMSVAGVFTGVGEWLARREELSPEKTGLVDMASGARLSYRALNVRARALATLLAERHGVRQGDRVVALAANSPEYLDAFFACALRGAILTPLNWRLTAPELVGIFADCEPVLALHDASHAGLARAAVAARGGPPLLDMAAFQGEDTALARRDVPFQTRDGEEIALILYTSGTTGVPKGAMLSHRMLTWNAINTQISWGLRESDSAPIFAPFFHAGGLNVLTTPLYHLGGTVVLPRDASPVAVLEAIAAERCTLLFAVPTVFQMILESPESATADLTSLRFLISGGSPCPMPVIEAYPARGLEFRQGYGLTEVGVNCFSLAPEDARRKAGSVGKPVFHSRARCG